MNPLQIGNTSETTTFKHGLTFSNNMCETDTMRNLTMTRPEILDFNDNFNSRFRTLNA